MTIINIREAAERLGVVEATVRRRIHRGEIEAVQQPTPQGFVWMVELPDDVDEVQAKSTGEVQALRELVGSLRSQVEAKDREVETRDRQMEILSQQLEAKDRQIGELHVLLQQAQAALPAPRNNRSWWQRVWRRG
jgi:predicted RNase H-like nuclease (RuvC/YqgF family)